MSKTEFMLNVNKIPTWGYQLRHYFAESIYVNKRVRNVKIITIFSLVDVSTPLNLQSSFGLCIPHQCRLSFTKWNRLLKTNNPYLVIYRLMIFYGVTKYIVFISNPVIVNYFKQIKRSHGWHTYYISFIIANDLKTSFLEQKNV